MSLPLEFYLAVRRDGLVLGGPVFVLGAMLSRPSKARVISAKDAWAAKACGHAVTMLSRPARLR